MIHPFYGELEKRFRRIHAVGEAENILHWDMATMMPPGGAESRGEQLAVLKSIRHSMIADPAVTDLLDGAETDTALDSWQRANLREMRRQWAHETALDAKLVEALSRACSRCETAWRRARPDADFKAVLPFLEVVLALTREAAEAMAARLGTGLYDALLDTYEPDGRSADIDPVFDELAAFLPGFTDDVLARQAARPAAELPRGPFPQRKQRELGVKLMQAMGFDFNFGRLDVSLHPFCGGTVDDVRITTRYDDEDFTTALMGVLHETGHALYDMGLPKTWAGQPVGRARSMAIHESQSLLMEMQACRSREFLTFAAPLMRAAFDGTSGTRASSAWDSENLYRLYTRVEKSFIRVDADEVTYPAHVILRYRLEKAAIAGDLKLADLPGAWNDGMQELLGITPPNDREGCLQDIHWYDGAWGYFPTYTLGAMTAAQLYEAALKANPEIPERIAQGDFQPLLAWLRPHVHGLASSISGREIVIAATGKPLDTEVFKAHLRRRYLGD